MSNELDNMDFDKRIREKYSEHGESVPNHLWTKINNEAALLETTSLRKRVAWFKWLSLSLVAILGGVIIFYQWDDDVTSDTLISQNINKEERVIDESNNEIGNGEHLVSVESLEVTKKNSISPSKKSELQTAANIEQESTPTDVKDVIAFENPSITKETTVIKEREVPNVEMPVEKNALIIITENNGKETGNNKMDLKEQQINPIETSKAVVEVVGNESTKKSKEDDKNKREDDMVNTSVANEYSINEEKAPVVVTDNIIVEENVVSESEVVFNSNNKNDSVFIDTAATNEPKIPVAVPVVSEKTLSKITASVFLIPYLSYRGFEASSSTNEIYKTNEGNQLRFSFGANVGYSISDKLTLHLGGNYRKFKHEIELNDVRPKELPILMDPVNRTITIYSSMGTIVANDIGNFEFAGDDEDDIFLDDEDDFASLNYKEAQEFTLLDIPLTVGYEIGKGKLKLLLEGGIVTSILITSKSKIEIGNIYSPEVLVSVENYHQTKKWFLVEQLALEQDIIYQDVSQ